MKDKSGLRGEGATRQSDDDDFVKAFEFPFSIVAKGRGERFGGTGKIERIRLFVSDKANPKRCHAIPSNRKKGMAE